MSSRVAHCLLVYKAVGYKGLPMLSLCAFKHLSFPSIDEAGDLYDCECAHRLCQVLACDSFMQFVDLGEL